MTAAFKKKYMQTHM